MPRDYMTEDGPHPEFATEFGAAEVDGGYKRRTEANVRDSDATVWFGDPTSPGGIATVRACHALGPPIYLVWTGRTRPSEVAEWIVRHYVEVLNVAGNRESTEPGIGDRVERFLVAAFRRVE